MIENYILLAKYNKWINKKIYLLAENLSDIERKTDHQAFFGSIHNSLNHLIITDKVWLGRFASQGIIFPDLKSDILEVEGGIKSLDQIVYDDFDQLMLHRFKIDEAIQNWITTMSDDFPSKTMIYFNMKGIKREHPVWQALTHFFNHQTHHRGQITTIFSQLGIDIGVTDLIAMPD